MYQGLNNKIDGFYYVSSTLLYFLICLQLIWIIFIVFYNITPPGHDHDKSPKSHITVT